MRTKRWLAFILAIVMVFAETTTSFAAATEVQENENQTVYEESVSENDTEHTTVTGNNPVINPEEEIVEDITDVTPEEEEEAVEEPGETDDKEAPGDIISDTECSFYSSVIIDGVFYLGTADIDDILEKSRIIIWEDDASTYVSLYDENMSVSIWSIEGDDVSGNEVTDASDLVAGNNYVLQASYGDICSLEYEFTVKNPVMLTVGKTKYISNNTVFGIELDFEKGYKIKSKANDGGWDASLEVFKENETVTYYATGMGYYSPNQSGICYFLMSGNGRVSFSETKKVAGVSSQRSREYVYETYGNTKYYRDITFTVSFYDETETSLYFADKYRLVDPEGNDYSYLLFGIDDYDEDYIIYYIGGYSCWFDYSYVGISETELINSPINESDTVDVSANVETIVAVNVNNPKLVVNAENSDVIVYSRDKSGDYWFVYPDEDGAFSGINTEFPVIVVIDSTSDVTVSFGTVEARDLLIETAADSNGYDNKTVYYKNIDSYLKTARTAKVVYADGTMGSNYSGIRYALVDETGKIISYDSDNGIKDIASGKYYILYYFGDVDNPILSKKWGPITVADMPAAKEITLGRKNTVYPTGEELKEGVNQKPLVFSVKLQKDKVYYRNAGLETVYSLLPGYVERINNYFIKINTTGTYYFYTYSSKPLEILFEENELGYVQDFEITNFDSDTVRYYDEDIRKTINPIDYSSLEMTIQFCKDGETITKTTTVGSELFKRYFSYYTSLKEQEGYNREFWIYSVYYDGEHQNKSKSYMYREESTEKLPVLSLDEPLNIDAGVTYVAVPVFEGNTYLVVYSNTPIDWSLTRQDETSNEPVIGENSFMIVAERTRIRYIRVEAAESLNLSLYLITDKAADIRVDAERIERVYGDNADLYDVWVVLNKGESQVECPGSAEVFKKYNITVKVVQASNTAKAVAKDSLMNYPAGNYKIIYYVNNIKTKTIDYVVNGVASNYKIKFDKNSENATGSVSTVSAKKNTVVALTKNSFKNTGFKFLGWSKTAQPALSEKATAAIIEAAVDYEDGAKVCNLSADGTDVVLYAVWQQEEYGITYVLSGGSFKEGYTPVTSFLANEEEDIVLPTKDNFEAVPNYEFDGFYTSEKLSASSKITTIAKGTTKSITVYAKWVPKKLQATFTAGEGVTGTMNAFDITYNKITKIPANRYSLKNNYLKGWNICDTFTMDVDGAVKITDVDGGYFVTVYNGKYIETCTFMLSEGTTFELSPVFSNQVSYTVIGLTGLNSEDTLNRNYYEETSLKTFKPSVEIKGYTFVGWYLDQNHKKKITSFKKNDSKEYTIYAYWKPDTYKVKYAPSECSGKTYEDKVNYGSGYYLKSPNTYSRPNYVLAGWSTNKGLTYPNYIELEGEKAEKDIHVTREPIADKDYKSMTLYPVWLATSYTLTLKYNYAVDDEVISYQYNKDTSPVNLSDYSNISRDGFKIVGWYKDPNFKTSVTSMKKQWGNITLYAKWSGKCTITFVNGDDELTKTQTVDYGKNSKLISRKNLGCNGTGVFMGWALSRDGEVVYKDGAVLNLKLTETSQSTMILYAVWKNKFEITYSNVANLNNLPDSYTYGEELILPTTSKKGCTFEGWYEDAKYKKSIKKISANRSGNITLYAKWKGFKYTISYNANAPYGTKASGKMKTQNLEYGKAQAISKNGYSVKGYTFKGWSSTANGSANYYDRQQITGVGSDVKSITLYAVWEVTEYTVTYCMFGVKDDVTDTYTVKDVYTLMDAPEKIGYTFQGWYTDKKCKKKATDLKAGTTGNVTFYAKWQENK